MRCRIQGDRTSDDAPTERTPGHINSEALAAAIMEEDIVRIVERALNSSCTEYVIRASAGRARCGL